MTTTGSASSRKSEHLFAQLAGNNLGPLGPAGCEGVLDQMDQGTLSNHASHHFNEVGGSFPAGGGGSPVPTSKASSGGGPSLQRSVHKSSIPSEEKGWLSPASYQFETTKWVCAETALQDGRLGYGERSPSVRRLDVFLGPQGCIPLGSHCQGTPQISLFPLGWLDL